MNFRTSSFCEASGCVEVGFTKSSFCGPGECVEVERGEQVVVRNSTNPDVQVTFTADEWRVFLQGVKNNEFDI